jgi:hypothetical protein
MNRHAYTKMSLFVKLTSNIKTAQRTWSCLCFQLISFQYSLPNQLEVFVTHNKIAHEKSHPADSIWSCNTDCAKRDECSEEEILEVCRIILKRSQINTLELLYFWLGWCGSKSYPLAAFNTWVMSASDSYLCHIIASLFTSFSSYFNFIFSTSEIIRTMNLSVHFL